MIPVILTLTEDLFDGILQHSHGVPAVFVIDDLKIASGLGLFPLIVTEINVENHDDLLELRVSGVLRTSLSKLPGKIQKTLSSVLSISFDVSFTLFLTKLDLLKSAIETQKFKANSKDLYYYDPDLIELVYSDETVRLVDDLERNVREEILAYFDDYLKNTVVLLKTTVDFN